MTYQFSTEPTENGNYVMHLPEMQYASYTEAGNDSVRPHLNVPQTALFLWGHRCYVLKGDWRAQLAFVAQESDGSPDALVEVVLQNSHSRIADFELLTAEEVLVPRLVSKLSEKFGPQEGGI